MNDDLAEKILTKLAVRTQDDLLRKADVKFLLAILMNKLEVHAPEEFESFKEIYLQKLFDIEI